MNLSMDLREKDFKKEIEGINEKIGLMTKDVQKGEAQIKELNSKIEKGGRSIDDQKG